MFFFPAACRVKTQSDPRWIINDLNVTFLERENSSSWYVRVSWNPFTGNSENSDLQRRLPQTSRWPITCRPPFRFRETAFDFKLLRYFVWQNVTRRGLFQIP